MLAAERLSQRYERWMVNGEAQSTVMLVDQQTKLVRALLRYAHHEGVKLRHGTIKHARDLIRYQEKRLVKCQKT